MKKYHKYGHHKKKKHDSLTLQFLVDFITKHKKKNSLVKVYIPLTLSDKIKIIQTECGNG